LKKKPGSARLDPPLKVLSFYRNEEEEKDFGDHMYDLLNSENEEDKRLITSDKGIVIAVDSESDMLYMRPYGIENQEAVYLIEKLKLNLLVSIEMD